MPPIIPYYTHLYYPIKHQVHCFVLVTCQSVTNIYPSAPLVPTTKSTRHRAPIKATLRGATDIISRAQAHTLYTLHSIIITQTTLSSEAPPSGECKQPAFVIYVYAGAWSSNHYKDTLENEFL